MRKTHTINGTPAYSIKLPICYTLSDFATALSEHSYANINGNIDFDNLTKTKAQGILLDRLQWHGRRGEYHAGDVGSDNQEEYNELFTKAAAWVRKNYPYLDGK